MTRDAKLRVPIKYNGQHNYLLWDIILIKRENIRNIRHNMTCLNLRDKARLLITFTFCEHHI